MEQNRPKISGKQLIFYHGNEILKHEQKTFAFRDKEMEDLYRQVYKYFAGDPSGIYNLKKSFLVIGSIGVGKSLLLKVMQRVFPYSFYRIEAQDLKKLVIANGAMQTLVDFGYAFKKNLLIDDLGMEDPQMKLWGDQPNIFADLFAERHNLYTDHGFKTHLVTNFTTDHLAQMYGERVYDRIMGDTKGNLIKWKGTSLRKI